MQKKSFVNRNSHGHFHDIAAFLRKNPYFIALLVCLPVGMIYFYFAEYITKNVFAPTGNNYYTYLLDAFFHGRTNVILSNTYDLSLFDGKWYLYWGPAPVLLILPFYLFSHLQTSDVLYTAIGGTVNVLLFYGVLQEFKKCFQISLSLMADIFLVLSFGLASPNFSLSLVGEIWATEQIFAITYLCLFYLLYFRFLNSGKYFQLILCAVFFCLACLSRFTLLFNGILFIYLFLYGKRLGRVIPMKIILSLTLLALAFVSLEALYNFQRFHNVLETGLRFQQGNVNSSGPIFSFQYMRKNIYYCFINIIHFSYSGAPVVIDKEGNSVFSVYPALLLLPVLFYRRKDLDKKRMSFLITAGIVIGLNVLLILLCFATGWIQFGYRYFLDVIPLAFLLLSFILPSIPLSIQMGLLQYGIFINFYGSMALSGLV